MDIAETVVNAVMVDRLKAALPLLSDSEQELIQAIFFDGLSEREVGARLGITQSVVNKTQSQNPNKTKKDNRKLKFKAFSPLFFLWEDEGLFSLPSQSILIGGSKNGIQPRTGGQEMAYLERSGGKAAA